MKNLLEKLWAARDEFSKYFVIGVGAVILDLGSLYLFKEILHLSPTWSVIINQLFVINYIFTLNKYWAFKSKGVTHKQIIRFYILYAGNYAISVAWMWLFTEHWHAAVTLALKASTAYLVVRLANIILSVGWNFMFYKYWVYKPELAQFSQNNDVHN